MTLYNQLDRDWQHLATSAQLRQRWQQWAQATPALAAYASAHDAVDALRRRPHPADADRVLRGLLHHRHDELACRTVVQALLPAIVKCARTIPWPASHDDLHAEAIAELWRRTRTYPLDRRPTRIAANLLADTRKHLLARLREERAAADALATNRGDIASDPVDDPLASVIDLVETSVRDGRLNTRDAALIVTTRLLDVPIADVAAADRTTTQTIRQRRLRAERRLARAAR